MSLWGKIVGLGAGMALGGPIGALIGLTVGAAVDEGIDYVGGGGGDATRQVTFTIGVIALAAKMAKADGRVTRDEIDAFKSVFRVPPEEMKNVGRVFDFARQDTAGYEAYAKQIASLMQGNRTVLSDLLDALFFIAKADGHVHPKEKAFLERVAAIFGFTKGDWVDMEIRHLGQDADTPYAILGVSPDADDAAIRARYRKLVKENHPDRLLAEGVPSDFIAVANRRAAEINAAYDTVVAERGMRR